MRTVDLSPHRKKKTYQESDMQSKITYWLKHSNQILAPCFFYECKLIKGNKPLSLSDFRPQQIPSLLQSETKEGLNFKLSDLDIRTKPCDGVFISNSVGYIFVEFYKPNKPHSFYAVMVDYFLNELKDKNKKSLTEQEISLIGRHFLL